METLHQPQSVMVVPLELNEEQWGKLEKYISTEIEQALTDRRGLEKSWEVWNKQYNARLPREGPGDADIDMPSTFKNIRQEQAKVIAPLFKDPEFWVVTPANPRANPYFREIGKVVEYISDKFDLLNFATVAYRQARVYSYVAVKMGWTVEKDTALTWKNLSDPVISRMMDPNNPDSESPIAVVKEQALIEETVETRVGCFPEVVPMEDFLFPWYSTDIHSAPWVAHRSWLTKWDLDDLIDNGHLPEDAREKLGEPEGIRPRTFALEQMSADVSKGDSRQYEMCEVYLDWKIDEGPRKSVICYFERKSGKLIHAIYNWLSWYRRPFELWTGEERDDGIPGVSQCFRLEPLHRAKSASIRQRLDAATLANQILFFYNSASDIGKHLTGGVIKSGGYPTTADLEKDLKQLKISEPAFNQMEGLERLFDADMQVMSGLNDPDFGAETAERPTATGTMKTMEAGGLPADLMRESFRRFLSRVMKQCLCRYKQMMPDGMKMYLREGSDDTLAAVTELVKWPDEMLMDDILIEPVVNSATINKNIRKAEAVAVVDKLPALYGFALQLAEAATQPSPTSFVAKDMLVAYLKAVETMLKELDVETREDFIGRIIEGVDVGGMFAQTLDKVQQEIQSLGQQNQALQAKLAQYPEPGHVPLYAGLPGGAGMGQKQTPAAGPTPGMAGTPPMVSPQAGLVG